MDFAQAESVGRNGQAPVRRLRVLLAVMPFASIASPSLALSLFHARLVNDGHTVRSRYYTFDLAEKIGAETYQLIADGFPATSDLIGEWIFSGPEFPLGVPDEGYLEGIQRTLLERPSLQAIRNPRAFVGTVRDARIDAATFIDACVEDVLQFAPDIVALTSTFQQHRSSIALASRIKKVAPQVVVVIGGANCEGVMGERTASSLDCFDAVFSGESDKSFPEFVEEIARSAPDLAGARHAPRCVAQSDAMDANALDALPFPAFDDFYSQFNETTFVGRIAPRLPLETSRGCWWGQKNHCTFCGLNGGTMGFRSKSPERAVREFEHVASRYGPVSVSTVDNILDYKYIDAVLPQLARIADRPGQQLDIFYEVKANLSEDKLKAIKAAGINTLQPGIESLSTDVLSRMRKGIKAVHNVQFLRLCREVGITPHWNLIWGFPGEHPEDYARMAEMAPKLTHLQPPGGCAQIRLDRFSPHFVTPSDFGIENVRPYASYKHIYDLSDEALADMAYFFEFDYADGRQPATYTKDLSEAVRSWRASASEAELILVPQSSGALVIDTRGDDVRATRLSEAETRILAFCHTAMPRQRVLFECLGSGDVERAIAALVAEGFLLELDGYCLALTINLDGLEVKELALKRIQCKVVDSQLMAMPLVA